MSIRLRSRRGAIGATWQGRALREAAEGILGVARATGGKADARAGRVQWLDVAPGSARAEVLDADGRLYAAEVNVPRLRPDDRAAFLDVARSHPELPARLAAGEYPEQIEGELARQEVSLLPRSAAELTHDCSCMDWPGPCRHVAALVYVLVEAVDETPEHLLTLRGLELADLVAAPDPGRSRTARSDAGPADVGPSAERPGPRTDPGSGGAVPSAQSRAGDDTEGEDREGTAPLPAARFTPQRLRAEDLAGLVGAEQATWLTAFFHEGSSDDLQ